MLRPLPIASTLIWAPDGAGNQFRSGLELLKHGGKELSAIVGLREEAKQGSTALSERSLPTEMFCLDFAISFFAHRGVLFVTHHVAGYPRTDGLAANLSLPFALASGAAAGGVAATALYPFDLVRMYTVQPGQSHFAKSTIPFMAVYLGVWSTFKNTTATDGSEARRTLRGRFTLALGATAAATVAELPFDLSKHNISGGLRQAMTLSLLRVPLGACLLLAYDEIASRASDPAGQDEDAACTTP
jgi:hypothetical protein